jgi:para-aminobenzoate synthetase/4-amino-4-deoxychorismate lyase
VVADPSLGVYETLLVRAGAVQALGAHLARLRGSMAALYGLEPPGDLEARIRELVAALGAGEHRLRLDVRPVDKAPQVTLQTSPLPPRPELFRLRPLTLAGGYGAHKLADRGPLASASSASDGPVALLIDSDATVLEAAWANVWLLEDERLVTPSLDGRILPGVTRARVIEQAASLGLRVTEEPITLARARVLARAGVGQPMLTSSLQLAAAAAFEDGPEPGRDAIEAIGRIRHALLETNWE